MPYIKTSTRENLDTDINKLVQKIIDQGEDGVCGNLNYVITRIIAASLALDTDPRYSKINGAIGVLECAKQELYRRIASPYEDTKIYQNGDVTEFEPVRIS